MRAFTLFCAALFAAIPVLAARGQDPKPPEGFAPLFNGKNLSGWQGNVDMKQRATLGRVELMNLQQNQTRKAHENWTVKDGVLHATGKGASLQTTEDFGNFELLVDWKIEKGGDSGIYVRGQPQIQIWDSDNLAENLKADAGKGSGGLWNNPPGDKAKQPLKKADKPVGEWNTFHIVMKGDKVTIKLNGKLVVDGVPLENYWDKDRKIPLPTTGQVELQNHGNTLWFKNIYIKELAPNQ